jgi:hypothetical protein
MKNVRFLCSTLYKYCGFCDFPQYNLVGLGGRE